MSYATTVHELMKLCLFKDAELDGGPPKDAIFVQGIVQSFALHKGRIEENKDILRKLAKEIIKDEFLKNGGGGFTFLHLPQSRDGELWCEQRTAEALFCLCKAAGFAEYCIPRDLWPALPGGVPYVIFDI